jgi:diadenosine tetraphosphate (Ap4A) HIT family hydrolase
MNRNATFETFGGSRTLVCDYAHWSVQVRPKQVTLGALVILSHSEAVAFSQLPQTAFAELAEVVKDVETVSTQAFANDRINYLMLMMVDPHVHFHVLPRYARPVMFGNAAYPDPGWPGQPDLSVKEGLPEAEEVVRHLRPLWPRKPGV